MRRLALLAAVVAAIAGAAATSAGATVTGCATTTVTIDLGATKYALTTIKRGASGELLVDGTACGNAASGRTVVVTGSGTNQELILDLTGGPLSDSGGDVHFTDSLGQDNVFVVTGSAGADVIVLGTGGVNLDAGPSDSDVDVTFTSGPRFLTAINGGAGADVISGAGTYGTGTQTTAGLILDGGADNDFLVGSSSGDTITGGSGADGSYGTSGDDHLLVNNGDGAADVLDGGPGSDTVSASEPNLAVSLAANTITGPTPGTDTLSGLENVDVYGANETVTGDSASNTIFLYGATSTAHAGGGGDTLKGKGQLFGQGGTDVFTDLFQASNTTFDGGGGTDYLDEHYGTHGVTADLGAGTLTGTGQSGNTLVSIEGAFGSAHHDVLRGTSGPNLLMGLDGNDTLEGKSGDDVLAGGNGNDTIDGGPGTDTCQQNAGTGTITNCAP